MFMLQPVKEKGNIISIRFKIKERNVDIADLNFSSSIKRFYLKNTHWNRTIQILLTQQQQ